MATAELERLRGNMLCQLGKGNGRDNNHSAVSTSKDQGTGARADLGQKINSISDLVNLR